MTNRRTIGGVDRDTLRFKYIIAMLNIANVAPVLIPTINNLELPEKRAKEAIRMIVKAVDMVLLTGDETNIDPRLYGLNHHEDNIDPYRDFTVIYLVELCIRLKKPLLGICRGIQEINVAFGGTLHPNLAKIGKIHTEDLSLPRDGQYRPVHYVDIQPGGVLDDWFDEKTLKVNSLHNQAICKVSPDLFIEAISQDGLVEAVSYMKDGNNILGVQWHPEWHADNEIVSKQLMNSFLNSVQVSENL